MIFVASLSRNLSMQKNTNGNGSGNNHSCSVMIVQVPIKNINFSTLAAVTELFFSDQSESTEAEGERPSEEEHEDVGGKNLVTLTKNNSLKTSLT